MREAYKPAVIEGVSPEPDCGRYPIKGEVDYVFEVRADIFKEGHDKLAAVLKHRLKGERGWVETPMDLLTPGFDRWGGSFELTENARYEYKVWDWDRTGNIKGYITRIDEIRRENPVLHELTNLTFHEAADENVLFYSKNSGENTVFVAVNLDPHEAHEATLSYPPGAVGEDEAYVVEELILRNGWEERGPSRRVRFDPGLNPAEIFRPGTPGTGV